MVTWRQWLEDAYWRWWDYRLRERHLSPWGRALRRHWHTLKASVPRPAQAIAHRRQEDPQMEDVTMPPTALATVGHMLRAKIDPESEAALRASYEEDFRADVIEQVRAEERARARVELAAEREDLYTEVDREKSAAWDEALRHISTAVAEARAGVDAEAERERQALEGRIDAQIARRKALEESYLALVCDLLPQDQPKVLWNYGVRTLDLQILALLLGKRGERIRAQPSPQKSSRVVQVTFPDGEVKPCTIFVREYLHAETPEPEETDALALPEASVDGEALTR